MATGADTDFNVGFNPYPMSTEVVRTRTKVRWLAVSVGIVVLVALVLSIWRYQVDPHFWVWGLAVSLLAIATWGFYVYRLTSGKKALAEIGHGVAFSITFDGFTIRPDQRIKAPEERKTTRHFSWDEIISIRSETFWLTGPQLVIKMTGNRRWAIPFSYVDVGQRTINEAIKVFSQGRFELVSDRPFAQLNS